MIPGGPANELRRRIAWCVAGGPAMSLLMGGAGLAADVLSPAGALADAFLATAIPMRTGSFYSDEARLLMLLRGTPDAERWAAVSAICAYRATPIVPMHSAPGWSPMFITWTAAMSISNPRRIWTRVAVTMPNSSGWRGCVIVPLSSAVPK